MPGTSARQARHPLADGQRPHVRPHPDTHRHGRELEHGRHVVQDRRPGQVQVREGLQGGWRFAVHVRGQREVERRGAAVCL